VIAVFAAQNKRVVTLSNGTDVYVYPLSVRRILALIAHDAERFNLFLTGMSGHLSLFYVSDSRTFLQILLKEVLALDNVKADDIDLDEYMPHDLAKILKNAQELFNDGFDAVKSVYGVIEKTSEGAK
jgi:hypothetical protein